MTNRDREPGDTENFEMQDLTPCSRRVVFVGGDPRWPSVRIRCVDIARGLGCDHVVDAHGLDRLPADKDVFVLVNNRTIDRRALRRRGVVCWDVHNHMPPALHVDHYLVSTEAARRAVRGAWFPGARSRRVHVIPHHHPNHEGTPNPLRAEKTVLWMGTRKWHPTLDGVEHEFFETTGCTVDEIHAQYRRADILLNQRSRVPTRHAEHVRLNPGAKLINAIGYGVPSISPAEPSFEEIGTQCTIIAEDADVGRWVDELKRSRDLYQEIRGRCIERAPAYALPNILERYRQWLESILHAG